MSTMNNKTVISDIINCWQQRFETEDIKEPKKSIEYLVAHVINVKKIDLAGLQKRKLTSKEMEKLEILCQWRLTGMPYQYILGNWNFRDIKLKLVPKVFVPELQTEMLVDIALKRISADNSKKSFDVLEVGCGSGAISLSLLHACNKIKILTIDTNPQACALTLENAENLNLQDRISVIHATLQENATIKVSSDRDIPDLNNIQFDYIVSNPPYEPAQEVYKSLAENKLFADVRATDGGYDGMKIIKPLLNYIAKVLKPGGHLFMEIDSVNSETIQLFVAENNNLKLKFVRAYKDMNNMDRFIEILKLD